MDLVQLCSGYITPLFEDTTLPITYLELSYIIGLRSRLSTIDASLRIEKSWVPALQREGDESLMAKFVTLPFITQAALRQANAVRLYLHVLTIADLADVGGTFIPAHMLTGEWQAGSDIKWPFQPLPPPSFWRTFRSCLRRAFSTGTPATQPASYLMILDTPLGRWLPVKRNTWFPAYRNNHHLYWRSDEEIHVYNRAPTSGFYHFSGTTAQLPLDCHPVHCRYFNDGTIWTQRKYCMAPADTDPVFPAGHEVSNTVTDPRIATIILGSDRSVHLAKKVATCALRMDGPPH